MICGQPREIFCYLENRGSKLYATAKNFRKIKLLWVLQNDGSVYTQRSSGLNSYLHPTDPIRVFSL